MVTINLAGKDYPMRFSTNAAKKIAAKHGDINEFLSSMSGKGLSDETALDELVEVVEILIYQGCAYKNYFEKDMPVKETDPVIDGKWTPLPKEALDIVIEYADWTVLAGKIVMCITKDKKGNIEQVNTSKNVEAGQE